MRLKNVFTKLSKRLGLGDVFASVAKDAYRQMWKEHLGLMIHLHLRYGPSLVMAGWRKDDAKKKAVLQKALAHEAKGTNVKRLAIYAKFSPPQKS